VGYAQSKLRGIHEYFNKFDRPFKQRTGLGREPMESEKVQVIIISQQSLFRFGIQQSLASVPDIVIAGNTDVNERVLETIDVMPPDVAILDIDGSSDAGLTLARKIKQHSPSIALVVLASNPTDEQLFAVLKVQAASYLSKETTAEKLVEILRRVAKGEHPINESLTTRPKVAEQVLLQFQELSLSNCKEITCTLYDIYV
jgi:DNA-binding NarL/FixJ family response regulator